MPDELVDDFALVLRLGNYVQSGANEVLLNALRSGLARRSLHALAPEPGPVAERLRELGAKVHLGDDLRPLLDALPSNAKPFVICNTAVTAPGVLQAWHFGVPNAWILHEWWDRATLKGSADAPASVLALSRLRAADVDEAMRLTGCAVFMCEGQRRMMAAEFAKPRRGEVVLPSVAPSFLDRANDPGGRRAGRDGATNFLVMGIVAPRKRQAHTVRLFQAAFPDRDDVRLTIVGARRERAFEREYLARVEEAAAGDPRVTIHPAALDPAPFYREADAVVLHSVSEVTPVVLAEAMTLGLPVAATITGGVPEMVEDGAQGLLTAPDDDAGALLALQRLADDPGLRERLGCAGRGRASLYDPARAALRYNAIIAEAASG